MIMEVAVVNSQSAMITTGFSAAARHVSRRRAGYHDGSL